jgi:hypothetical protein
LDRAELGDPQWGAAVASYMKQVTHDGKQWCSISDAAAYLRTNAKKIKDMIGEGKLTCTQIRANGNIYVSVHDLVRIQKEKLGMR